MSILPVSLVVVVVFLFKMWENAVHCWTDLQHYRELFYQEGFDPYRVQREAQVGSDCDPPQTSGLIVSDTLRDDVQ